jgi:hypothetical protein
VDEEAQQHVVADGRVVGIRVTEVAINTGVVVVVEELGVDEVEEEVAKKEAGEDEGDEEAAVAAVRNPLGKKRQLPPATRWSFRARCTACHGPGSIPSCRPYAQTAQTWSHAYSNTRPSATLPSVQQPPKRGDISAPTHHHHHHHHRQLRMMTRKKTCRRQ